jgi:catechol 2,3-dioxygenase-like lactoylglutathione lyase family enzyme
MSLLNRIHIQRIRAIGITVSDADRSKEFYTQALRFQLVSDITITGPEYSQLVGVPDATIRIVTLQLGNEYIELMQYLNLQGKPIPADSQSNDSWFQHLAIVVCDMELAYAHLQAFTMESISVSPQTIPLSNSAAAGIRAFKFKDPDCHPLELIWFPPDKGQARWHQPVDSYRDPLFLGIDHSAIAIADTEQSLHFYRDLLGMQVDGGSLNQEETQARLDGLPEAKVRVTALRPAQGGLGIELLDYLVPANGRPMPNSWKSYDIAHLHLELVVNDLEQAVERLRQNGVQFVSPLVHFTDPNTPYRQGCLMKDPNGHAMMGITMRQ